MDDDLRARVEALEREVERLKSWQPVTPVQPPPTPPRPAKPTAWHLDADKAALESRIGGRWLAMAGITLLVIAVVFFFQLAVERGWIGLAAQVVLGALFGLALWGAGIVMAAKQKLTGFAQVIAAGGVAIAAFAVFVAHHFETYQAATGIGLLTDSILLGLLGLGAALDAGFRKVPVQAGTATGLIVWTSLAGLDSTGFSLAYTVFMIAVMLAVGIWRAWPWIAATAAPASALVYATHLIDGTAPGLVLGCIILVHGFILAAATRPRQIDAATIAGHIVAWLTVWLLGAYAWTEWLQDAEFSWWSFIVAAAGFGAAFLVKPKELRLTAAIAGTVAAVAAPIFLDPEWARIPIWILLFAAAEAVRRFKGWTTSVSVRPIVLLLIIAEAGEHAVPRIEDRVGAWVADIGLLLVAAALAGLAWHGERRAKGDRLILPLFNLGLGLIILLFLAVGLFTGPGVSVAWAIIAIGLVVAGFIVDEAQIRIAGLSVFALVLLRIVAIDLDGVDAIWRVLAFMGIAALLLLASWLYVRNAAKQAD